jgi:hypothetical protein
MAEGTNDLIQFPGGALVADMLSDASAEDAQELTQFAVEDGSSINDHVVRQPKRLTLQLVQTETPLRFDLEGFDQVQRTVDVPTRPVGNQTNEVQVRQKEFRPTSLLALSQAAQAALFGGPPKTLRITGLKSDGAIELKPLKVTVLARDGDVGRVNAFHDQLLALLDSVTPVQVTVKQRVYPDMIVISVSRSDAAGQVGCARFAVTLQQVRTAETRQVELPPVPAATKASNRGKSDGIKYDEAFGPPPPPATQLLNNLFETGVLSR